MSNAALDPNSAAMISALQTRGWGTGDFRMDFSLDVLEANASTPRREFTPTDDFYTPDCDHLPVPLPEGGNLEGEDAYACTTDGDCHLLVVDRDAHQLFEMWRTNLVGNSLQGGCMALWDLTRVYGPTGRGDQCTSADAAGYPITPLLMTADEVAAGHVPHALRLILPNAAIRDGEFFHPATHAVNVGGGGATAIPYGARLRLKASFDETTIADPDARVIVRALKQFGMFLADGGNVPITAQSDRHTVAKWDDLLEQGSHALSSIQPQDFEVVALEGSAIPLTYDCMR